MSSPAFAPNEAQRIRDACGLGTSCAACGHPQTPRDLLVLAADGYRVHVSHVITEGDGYYGVPFTAGPDWLDGLERRAADLERQLAGLRPGGVPS